MEGLSLPQRGNFYFCIFFFITELIATSRGILAPVGFSRAVRENSNEKRDNDGRDTRLFLIVASPHSQDYFTLYILTMKVSRVSCIDLGGRCLMGVPGGEQPKVWITPAEKRLAA